MEGENFAGWMRSRAKELPGKHTLWKIMYHWQEQIKMFYIRKQHMHRAKAQQTWKKSRMKWAERHGSSCQQWSADRPLCFRRTLCTNLDHLHGGVESIDVSESGSRFSISIFTLFWTQSHWACTCALLGLLFHSFPNCLFPFTEREHICHTLWILPWHSTLGHKSMSCPWGIILGKQHEVSETQSWQDVCLSVSLSSTYVSIYLSIICLSIVYLSNLVFSITQGSLEKPSK